MTAAKYAHLNSVSRNDESVYAFSEHAGTKELWLFLHAYIPFI